MLSDHALSRLCFKSHLPLRFIKGFIYRHKERCPENEYFLDYVRYSFLMKLHRNLPKNVLDKSWPTPPAALSEVQRDKIRMVEKRYMNQKLRLRFDQNILKNMISSYIRIKLEKFE